VESVVKNKKYQKIAIFYPQIHSEKRFKYSLLHEMIFYYLTGRSLDIIKTNNFETARQRGFFIFLRFELTPREKPNYNKYENTKEESYL